MTYSARHGLKKIERVRQLMSNKCTITHYMGVELTIGESIGLMAALMFFTIAGILWSFSTAWSVVLLLLTYNAGHSGIRAIIRQKGGAE